MYGISKDKTPGPRKESISSLLSRFRGREIGKGLRGRGGGGLLFLRGVDEGDSLLNVSLQAGDGSFQQGLLLVGDISDDVDSLLGTVGLEDKKTDGSANYRR